MVDNTEQTSIAPSATRRRYMKATGAVAVGALASSAVAADGRTDPSTFSDEFLEAVENGEPVYGVSASLAGMDPVTVTSHVDTDWIWIDTEHASYDVREVREMMSVIPEDTAGITRVPGADPKEVERVLDAGSDGVIVPKLRTVEEVEEFVASAYYPPKGDRGVAGSPASTFGLEFDEEYMQTANESVFVVIQVETAELVDNIDRVAQIEGIDSLLIGPADLSSQLGDPLDTDTAEFQRAVDRVRRAAERNDVAPGYWIGLDDAEPFVEEGWQVLSLGSDAALLAQAVQERIDDSP